MIEADGDEKPADDVQGNNTNPFGKPSAEMPEGDELPARPTAKPQRPGADGKPPRRSPPESDR